jgi:hypothetical protein
MIDYLNAEEADADEVERLEGRIGDAVDSESEGSDGRPKVDESNSSEDEVCLLCDLSWCREFWMQKFSEVYVNLII